jgi:hypothetical protein
MAMSCSVQYFAYFFLWTFCTNSLADLDSESQTTGCHRVKQAYLREHIGPADLVPSEPIYGILYYFYYYPHYFKYSFFFFFFYFGIIIF